MDVRVDHRQRVLRALGVVPYALRARVRPDRAGHRMGAADQAGTVVWPHERGCVLVLPDPCSAAELRLVDRIMQVLGGAFAEASRVEVVDGELGASVPHARAYLAFGEAQARALGRSLPADVMAQADVLLVDAPEGLFHASAKRRMWQAVGGLRRQWRNAVGTRE